MRRFQGQSKTGLVLVGRKKKKRSSQKWSGNIPNENYRQAIKSRVHRRLQRGSAKGSWFPFGSWLKSKPPLMTEIGEEGDNCNGGAKQSAVSP